MNEEMIGSITDKLSKEIGIAVEQLQPLAEEVVRQYASREYMFAGCFAASATIAVCVAVIGVVVSIKRQEDEEVSMALAVGAVFALIVAAICFAVGASHLANAIAPLPSLMGL